MMLKNALFVSLLITLLSCSSVNSTYTTTSSSAAIKSFNEQIQAVNWNKNSLNNHVTWNHHQFQDLFSSVQSITVIEIKKMGKKMKAEVVYTPTGFKKTSAFGTDSEALVAINGSFFDTKNGGSVVFFKQDGTIINETRAGFSAYRGAAGFSILQKGTVQIQPEPTTGWSSATANTILTSGPILRLAGQDVIQEPTKFNTNRHPRTAIGTTPDGRVLAVVVDGRSAQAQGVSIAELTQIMAALGCDDSMNLDGGGSSTAWIKNRGVVNFPSDNKTYDHQGERAVVNALIFKEQ